MPLPGKIFGVLPGPKGVQPSQITALVMDRPRHDDDIVAAMPAKQGRPFA